MNATVTGKAMICCPCGIYRITNDDDHTARAKQDGWRCLRVEGTDMHGRTVLKGICPECNNLNDDQD